jgi:hypothetical protein
VSDGFPTFMPFLIKFAIHWCFETIHDDFFYPTWLKRACPKPLLAPVLALRPFAI